MTLEQIVIELEESGRLLEVAVAVHASNVLELLERRGRAIAALKSRKRTPADGDFQKRLEAAWEVGLRVEKQFRDKRGRLTTELSGWNQKSALRRFDPDQEPGRQARLDVKV
jgi:predicted RNA-binding protein YlqC (UPF0109 family)